MNTQCGNRNSSQRWSNLLLLCCAGLAFTSTSATADNDKPVTVKMFAPGQGDHAGIGGRGLS